VVFARIPLLFFGLSSAVHFIDSSLSFLPQFVDLPFPPPVFAWDDRQTCFLSPHPPPSLSLKFFFSTLRRRVPSFSAFPSLFLLEFAHILFPPRTPLPQPSGLFSPQPRKKGFFSPPIPHAEVSSVLCSFRLDTLANVCAPFFPRKRPVQPSFLS